jgi:hypothetical protein
MSSAHNPTWCSLARSVNSIPGRLTSTSNMPATGRPQPTTSHPVNNPVGLPTASGSISIGVSPSQQLPGRGRHHHHGHRRQPRVVVLQPLGHLGSPPFTGDSSSHVRGSCQLRRLCLDDLELELELDPVRGELLRLTGPGASACRRPRELLAVRLLVPLLAVRLLRPLVAVAARPRGAAVIPNHAGALVEVCFPPAT